MRSSKNRSRSKGNRNRSVGNIVNRVFDSSGPEGKVRGTPQQIIDKYNQLARDAQLSNDRVAAENFQQHAEHYTRLLSEAQREQDARREQQEAQQQRAEANRQSKSKNDDNRGGSDEPRGEGRNPRENATEEEQGGGSGFDEVLGPAGGDAGLVETPEESGPKRGRGRRSRKSQQAGSGAEEGGDAQASKGAEGGEQDGQPEAAE